VETCYVRPEKKDHTPASNITSVQAGISQNKSKILSFVLFERQNLSKISNFPSLNFVIDL
jgi:hypothetical protein